MEPWAENPEDVLKHFHVTTTKGLTSAQVAEQEAKFGKNELDEKPGKSLFELVLEQFDDILVKVLLAAAVLSFVLAFFEEEEGFNAFVEPFVILLILIINAIVGVWQESNAENALEALKKMQATHTRTLRDGEWIQELETSDLVPGDIVQIKVGDKCPADCRMVEMKSRAFYADQSALTGESTTVAKECAWIGAKGLDTPQAKLNMVFAGTTVDRGDGLFCVTATGMSTEIGEIQKGVMDAEEDEEKTPLGEKLDNFGETLCNVIMVICLVVWIMSYQKFFDPMTGELSLHQIVYYLKIAVALGVAAIPEGLPAVITLCLALGTKKMVKRNAIVRKLPSVETLGCCSVICSDKTGTLTTNQMTVISVVVAAKADTLKELTVQGVDYSPRGKAGNTGRAAVESLPAFKADSSYAALAKVCHWCNDSEIKIVDDEYARIGEPTEAALRVLVEKLGYPGAPDSAGAMPDPTAHNNKYHAETALEATLEFVRDRKSMSVLCSDRTLYIKGAAEIMLERCSEVMLEDGKVVKMSAAMRKTIGDQILEMAGRPLRVLGLAVKKSMGPADKLPTDSSKFADIESSMIWTGLVGIKDPARPEVAPAIAMCKEAGIRVIMITGDNEITAEAISKEVGIFEPGEDTTDKVFISSDFFSEQYTDKQREHLIAAGGGGRAFARTKPTDKQKLVKLLGHLGQIAAMTGDGVNDAPALKQARIGIAMGIAGTEVAKEASDMILVDDNFATIVSAVEEGRSIYSNMKAFIRYMISSNIGEVASIFFVAALGLPEGLIPVQLLWVNLVTDGPPATALGFNPPDPECMRQPPRGEEDELISNWVFFRYMVIGAYVGFATVGVFAFWFIYYDAFVLYIGPEYMDMLGSKTDGHSMVSWEQLTHWDHCKIGMAGKGTEADNALWKGFAPKDFDWNDDGTGVNTFKDPCDYFSDGKVKASTLSLSVLVTIEMFNALNAISEDGSLLTMPPWCNPWLLLAMGSSFVLHFVILYIPSLAAIFTIAPHNLLEWLVVVGFSFPVIIIDEFLKMIGRFLNESARTKRLAEMEAAKKSA